MTFKATVMVDNLEKSLEELREAGFLAKQSSEQPDVVFIYGKDKEALIAAVKEQHKLRGFENIEFSDEYFESLIDNEKVEDEELLSAVKEPEHKEVAIEENKTEQDLYKEVHPLDLGGVKHAVDDEELLGKVKEGDNFKVKLDPVEPTNEAVKVTEAQTQRGGSGNPGEREEAAEKEDEKSQAEKDRKGGEVIADAVKISTSNENSKDKK